MSWDGSKLVKDWIRRCCGLQTSNDKWRRFSTSCLFLFHMLMAILFLVGEVVDVFTMAMGCGIVEMSKSRQKSEPSLTEKAGSVTGERRAHRSHRVELSKGYCTVHGSLFK